MTRHTDTQSMGDAHADDDDVHSDAMSVDGWSLHGCDSDDSDAHDDSDDDMGADDSYGADAAAAEEEEMCAYETDVHLHALKDTVGTDSGVQRHSSSATQQTHVLGTKDTSVKMLRTGGQAEKYVFFDEIGRGGMGTVVRAYDSNLRRDVAMKRILKSSNERIRLRFIEEAQITGQLEHPHIVPVHEIGRDKQDRLYFTMKLVRGQTLSAILDDIRHDEKIERERKHGKGKHAQGDDIKNLTSRYSPEALLHAFINVCHAIDFAHSRGVLHRDLKPDNIMLGEFGEVQVMDWGLAKAQSVKKYPGQAGEGHRTRSQGGNDSATVADAVSVAEKRSVTDDNEALATSFAHTLHDQIESVRQEHEPQLTMDGQVIGTLAYMPPEQAMGANDVLDERSDVYTLGAILYEILTLTTPLETTRKTKDEMIQDVCRGQFPRPKARAPWRSIPTGLDAIAMKALAREQGHRYQSVKELRLDMELSLSGYAVSAKVDSYREAVYKFFLRNKMVSTIAGISCLCILLLVFFGGRQQRLVEKAQTQVARLTQERVDSSLRTWYEMHQEFFDTEHIENEWDISIADQDISTALTGTQDMGEYFHNNADGMEITAAEQQVVMLYRTPFVGDIKMTYEATWVGGDEGGFHAILHGSSEQAGYIFRIGGWENTRTALLRADSNGVKEMARSQFTLHAGQRYAVEVRKTGNVLSLYIDDKKILEASDARENVLIGGPYSHCGLISGKGAQSIYHHVALYKYGAPKAVDLLDAADQFMLNARYQTASDIYRDVFNSLTTRERTERGRIGLKRAEESLGLEDTKDDYLSVLTKRWKNFESNLWIEHKELQLDLRNKDINDVKVLRGMKLQRLNISGCKKVREISALHKMPLTWLNIAHTRVSDIRSLRGMDLQYLNAAHAQLTKKTMYVLRGMPLAYVDISYCKIDTLSFLKNSALLEELYMSHTGLSALSGLSEQTHEVLRILDISHNPLSEIAPVLGVPLKELYLNNTQVQHLDALRGMHTLRVLDIGGLDIDAAAASIVSALPLTYLALDYARIDSLECVRFLSLRSLSIVGIENVDISPLHGAGLHTLRLSLDGDERAYANKIEVIRSMTGLQRIAIDSAETMNIDAFWQLWAEGHFDDVRAELRNDVQDESEVVNDGND